MDALTPNKRKENAMIETFVVCNLCGTRERLEYNDGEHFPMGWVALEELRCLFNGNPVLAHLCRECAEEVVTAVKELPELTPLPEAAPGETPFS